MLFNTVLSTVLLVAYASAQNAEQSSSITRSAELACATGEARTKFESCSSSISSEIDNCKDNDLSCACSLANSGFQCLTSHCPAHTSAICEGSLALHGLCGIIGVAVPTLTHVTCPSSVVNIFGSAIPASLLSLISGGGDIPSDIAQLLPSDINTKLPGDVPFWNRGNDFRVQETGSTQTGTRSETGTHTESMAVAMKTNSANVGLRKTRGSGGLEHVIAVGVVVSVAIGGLAAWL